LRACVRAYVNVSVWICACTFVNMCVHVFVNTSVDASSCVFTVVHVNIRFVLCNYICMYVFVCEYLFVPLMLNAPRVLRARKSAGAAVQRQSLLRKLSRQGSHAILATYQFAKAAILTTLTARITLKH
jgi:hypothetical protein